MGEASNTPAALIEEVKKYDFVQFIIPDVYGRPKGKVFTGRFKEKAARDGLDMFNATPIAFGPDHQIILSVFDITGWHWPNHHLQPCLETLTPWPWVGDGTRRHGTALCDLLCPDGTPDMLSPRQILKAQLDTLRERHGLVIKTAFEYEFILYEQATNKPRADHPMMFADMHVWFRHEALFSELIKDVLEPMGVEVSYWNPEGYSGQWELTTEPFQGVRGADVAFYVKTAIKGFFQFRGYNATFMAKTEEGGNGLHLNHSLWKPSRDGKGDVSVMSDARDPHNMSPTARHWLAGVLTHTPALCALMCPTVNCYRRLCQFDTPNEVSWGALDRSTMVRHLNLTENAFLEHRLPSGAANPYLALAGLVAAGIDGLDRQLELQPPAAKGKRGNGGPLPKSLTESLVALEEDQQMRERLGDRFVQSYSRLKRDGEIKSFEKADLKTAEEELEFEKNMFVNFL